MENLAGEGENGGLRPPFRRTSEAVIQGVEGHLSDNNPDDDKVLELRYMRKPD
jgi:hypothetical protein